MIKSSQLVRDIGNEHTFTTYQLLPYRIMQVSFLLFADMQGFWVHEILSKISFGPRANEILFVKNIDGKNVEWSLGAALCFFLVFSQSRLEGNDPFSTIIF